MCMLFILFLRLHKIYVHFVSKVKVKAQSMRCSPLGLSREAYRQPFISQLKLIY